MATLPRSFWRLGSMLEDRISTAIRQIPYNAWWEDHITYEWLSSIVPVLNSAKLEGTTEERDIACSLFKVRGRVEQDHGDVAVLVTQTFHDGLSVTGAGFLEAKACDRDTDGFSSLKSVQLERLYRYARYPKFLLYDRERINSDSIELTHPASIDFDVPYGYTADGAGLPFTYAAVVPMRVMRDKVWRNRRAYRFAVPLSHQLAYRYLLGLDLDTDPAVVASVLTAKEREKASTYVLSVAIGGRKDSDTPSAPPAPQGDLYSESKKSIF